MGIEKNIDDLFEGTEEDSSTQTEEEHKRLSDIIFKEPQEAATKTDFPDPAERREFTRTDIADKRIELKFSNEYQFARQYIDNISLGGLFVKTAERRTMGDILPISFNLPATNDLPERNFELKGKVCRITDQGLGLEFTNLTDESRKLLEEYVRNVLPKGMDVRARAKQSTLDRLEQLRRRKALNKQRSRRTFKITLALTGLFLLNAYLAVQSLMTHSNFDLKNPNRFKVNGEMIQSKDVKSLGTDKNGKIVLHLTGGSTVEVKNISNLPYHLRYSANIIKTIPPAKRRRRSKNAGNLIQLRYR